VRYIYVSKIFVQSKMKEERRKKKEETTKILFNKRKVNTCM